MTVANGVTNARACPRGRNFLLQTKIFIPSIFTWERVERLMTPLQNVQYQLRRDRGGLDVTTSVSSELLTTAAVKWLARLQGTRTVVALAQHNFSRSYAKSARSAWISIAMKKATRSDTS